MALDSIGALVAPKPLRLGHAQAGERLGMALDSIGALASRKGRNVPDGAGKNRRPCIGLFPGRQETLNSL